MITSPFKDIPLLVWLKVTIPLRTTTKYYYWPIISLTSTKNQKYFFQTILVKKYFPLTVFVQSAFSML